MKYENCLAENELYRNSSTWSDHADDMTLRLTFDLTFFINQPSLSINLLHQLAFFLNKLSLSINILYVGWLSSLAQLLRLFVLFQILGGDWSELPVSDLFCYHHQLYFILTVLMFYWFKFCLKCEKTVSVRHFIALKLTHCALLQFVNSLFVVKY